MYAIVDIAGQQFKVEKNQQLFVHRLEGEEGSKVDFNQVLLIDDKGKIKVGTPALEGASVSAKIVEHLKGDKVIVFRKKRRKGYKVRNGHRQYLTKIQIEAISESGSKKTKAAATENISNEEVAAAPKAKRSTKKATEE
ncbi:MAG: 50S ribosomal protein L21 [Vicingaceae bacterium]|nr:MAG: 50S ribosomal protein L21 [Vicingaceae bacterium]